MQALTQSASAADGAQRAPAIWRTVLGVFKLRIGFAIALTALAGVAVAPGAAGGGTEFDLSMALRPTVALPAVANRGGE